MILRKTQLLGRARMPVDSTPRTFACLISMPGRPRAQHGYGHFHSGRTLGAPHTIERGASRPDIDPAKSEAGRRWDAYDIDELGRRLPR